MRATVFTAFGSIFFLARLAAAQPPVYAEAGPVDRAHLLIEGAKTFTPEQISQALWNDLDVVQAGIMPWAGGMPWAYGEQRRRLVEKTIAGYRDAGFPQVQVLLEDNDNRAVLRIEEGPRFMAGDVRVEGAKTIDSSRLIEGLKPLPPESTGSGMRWPTGEPAWFDTTSETQLAERIAALLAEQGYYQPRFFLRIECDTTDNTAALVIDFDGEGRLSTAADLVIEGNQKNSRDDILKYLDIRDDASLTGELRGQMTSRLIASGRFVRYDWTLGELSQRVDGWQPKLKVEEYADAPGLSEPLSREEAALLKFSQWVAAFETSDEEILLSIHGAGEWADVIVAPRDGFVALYGVCGEDQRPLPFRAAAIMSEKQFGLYSVAQRRKIVAVPPPAHMVADGSAVVVDGAPKWDGRSALMFGVGLNSKARKGSRRHLRLHLTQTASGALSVIRKHQASCSWEGDILTAAWNGRTLRIDATSGRLIEHVVIDRPGDEHKPKATAADASTVRMATVPGEYARRLAEIDAATADFENPADTTRPLSCVAEFVCQELHAQGRLDGFPACQRAVPVLTKLSTRGLFKALDDLLLMAKGPAKQPFYIPLAPGTISRFHDWRSAPKWLATYFGARSGDALFGHTGWLADVWRGEMLFLARGELLAPGSFGDRPLEGDFGQATPRCGPLWALAVAELLHLQSLDSPAAHYAQQGLSKLSARDFRRDCRELLSGKGLASQYFLEIAEILRGLEPGEMKTLTDALVELDVLGADAAQRCVGFATLLRAADEKSIGKALAQALDHAWKLGLSSWVDERLQQLSNLPDPFPPVFAGPGDNPSSVGAYGPPAYAMPAAAVPQLNGQPRYEPAPKTAGGYAAGPMYNYVPQSRPLLPPDAVATEANDMPAQIARLEALVRSLAYRVAELESRVPPSSDEPEDDESHLPPANCASAY